MTIRSFLKLLLPTHTHTQRLECQLGKIKFSRSAVSQWNDRKFFLNSVYSTRIFRFFPPISREYFLLFISEQQHFITKRSKQEGQKKTIINKRNNYTCSTGLHRWNVLCKARGQLSKWKIKLDCFGVFISIPLELFELFSQSVLSIKLIWFNPISTNHVEVAIEICRQK